MEKKEETKKKEVIITLNPSVEQHKSVTDYVNHDFGLEAEDLQERLSNFLFIRPILKDGNSFVRAVAYAYIERILMTRSEAFPSFIELLRSNVRFFQFDYLLPLIEKHVFPVLTRIDSKRSSSRKEALQEFFSQITTNLDFDQTLIRAFRMMAKNFAKVNFLENLDGESIQPQALAKNGNVEDFIAKQITKAGVEPIRIIRKLFPLILRIRIVIFSSQPEAPQAYPSTNPGFNSVFNDGLDFHDQVIHLFVTNDHFDILYEKPFCETYSMALDYDTAREPDKPIDEYINNHTHQPIVQQQPLPAPPPLPPIQRIKLACCGQEVELRTILSRIEPKQYTYLFTQPSPVPLLIKGAIYCPANQDHVLLWTDLQTLVKNHFQIELKEYFSHFCSTCGYYIIGRDYINCACKKEHKLCESCNYTPGPCNICIYFPEPAPAKKCCSCWKALFG